MRDVLEVINLAMISLDLDLGIDLDALGVDQPLDFINLIPISTTMRQVGLIFLLNI